ncbi:MAG: hypothetical protein QNJ98_16530 [Planctomycetota bacterium]|nr:hypothetical protein [Planctomycetota bacterium]
MLARLATVLICACLLPACGGGSSGGPADTQLLATPSLDGYVSQGGISLPGLNVQTAGFGRAGSGGVCSLGTPPSCLQLRQFYVFDRPALPAGATIVSARLFVYQESIEGDPYTELGRLLADHVDIGGTLSESDFDGGTLSSDIGTLSTDSTLEYKTLDVTAAVEADALAGRDTSAFRLRFLRGANGSRASAMLTTIEDLNATGRLPLLEITYAMP